MRKRNRWALKETEGACERLGRGEQILLLRKGGIEDVREGFRVEHREFFLYPTLYHQDDVRSGPVPLDFYAVVEDAVHVTEEGRAVSLAPFQHLGVGEVRKRFHYRNRPGLWALLLRIHPVARVEVDETPAMAGCKSWVDLGKEFPVRGAGFVLNRTDFRRKMEAVHRVLLPNTDR